VAVLAISQVSSYCGYLLPGISNSKLEAFCYSELQELKRYSNLEYICVPSAVCVILHKSLILMIIHCSSRTTVNIYFFFMLEECNLVGVNLDKIVQQLKLV
jgi:hypothetical protein